MLGLRYFKKHKKQKSQNSEEPLETASQSLSTTSTHNQAPLTTATPTQSIVHTEGSRSKRSSFASRFRRSSSIEVPATVSGSSHWGSRPDSATLPDTIIATSPSANSQPKKSLLSQPEPPESQFEHSVPQTSIPITKEFPQDPVLDNRVPAQVAVNVSSPIQATRPAHQLSIAANLTSQVSVVSHTSPSLKNFVQSYNMMSPKLSSPIGFGNLNGSNGVFSPPMSPGGALRSKGRLDSFTSSRATSGNFTKSFGKRGVSGAGYKIGFVQESAISLRKRSMAELGAGVHQNISDVSYVNFLEWIRAERLTTLPHKGSRWDKVLIRALYFAEQLHNFDRAIQGFALDSQAAAAVGYGHARLLLELGHENSAALDKAFAVFYKFSLSFSSVLRRSELLAATSEIREQLCFLYTDLISLVVDVSVRFYKTANGMSSGSASLDIFELFGETIEGFRSRQDSVVELIWESQIEGEEFEDGETLDVKVLSRWLSSQDRVLATLNRDHSFFVDQQVEMTCIWFQKYLTRFLQSDKSFLLVTGQPGSGKTTLAGSIVERLQRPVNRKQVDTLFCSLSPDIPTTATSLAVVKSLLCQLLNQRVGNMGIYYALFRAYHHCRASDNLQSYEEHLWSALGDALKHPLDGGNDLVMVVDGLDEIESSQSASIQAAGGISSAKLLEKLVNVTNQGQKVRLITLSSNAKMPAQANGMLHEVTREDIRDDLHAVALRALIHNHHFHSKPGNEQETTLDRLIQTANGSFLWTILACELLNAQKSADGVTSTLKDLETNKYPVQSLVHKLFTSFEPTNGAKTLLSWVLAAERPLTTEEIHILFTVDVKNNTITDKGVNVHEILKTLKPFLSMNEHIVRFRHPIVHSALHELAQKNQISIPLKDSETDLLLRVLSYAKFTLRDKGEPTIDNGDPTVADRLFKQHRFLEYTVRYWILHLQQSPLMPKNGADFKPSPDLQKVLPDTTTLPILEQIVWGTQLPLPQAIDLHFLSGKVRKAVFTENHPTVLQTYLAIATSYLLLSDTKNASSYFFSCTKICRTVLSDIHPLTLECANHFLKISETLITTTRTETMTRREETLAILITAYERQYGSTSELVIQTRQLLAELYVSLKEEDKAIEVFRLIQEATIQHYGRNSHQAQDIEGHLNVVLGKGRGERRIDSYKEYFFDDHDDEDEAEVFDFGSIALYLRKAESYISRKEFGLAERTYVELWQRISSQTRTTQSIEWHEKNIEVATAYSQYLKTQKRTTESSAVLTVVWEQYQHHQLSYSESIVARLTSVAKEMKSMGSYTMALSIFKHASSYYKNLRQEESSVSREINKEVSETSTELVRQSLASSSSSSETTTTVSESVYKDVFFSIIQSSKTVDSSTIALAKKLSAKYMEERNFSQAISVIQATLQRTWSTFLSSSIHNVTLTSTFTQESVELVERLAECYLQLKQMERVEDTYSRFFRAALVTEKVDKAVFEKARNLLISFYDKHGYQDNAISVYQDILVTYRTRFGPTHELTIQTLYILARRCQQNQRNHPYWIEYYLQIITSLNKDSDVCHKDALDAIIVVTTTYWQDRRYAEAVTIYRTLWNTFVRQTKQHKIFAEEKFAQTLFERYYQCLEETKASFETLYQVAKEFRETAIVTFGAQSSIAVEATLALAQVSQRSEEHLSQAISLYEEASKSTKTTTTTTRSNEMKQALSSLYVRQMKSQSSSSYKAEHVERALSMTQEQLTESTSKHGYSHESSLSHVRELATLYQRQQKSDLAVKTLTTAASQIISKETSSQKQVESAASIAASFHACQQTTVAHSLVQELHRQICAKDTRYSSKWSFDLTKTGRTSLAFLASLQYNLRKDLNITFAEIMASLTMEYIYFEQFRNTLQNNESLTNILLAGAPLRFFLRHNGQDEMITVVEDQAVSLFEKRDAQDLQTLSRETPRIFIVGILDHLGSGRNKDFNRSVINASNDSVAKLTKAKKFPEAYDIANLGFLYASKHDGYNGPRSIGLGFKLASLLVGRDSEKATDAALRKKMLDLSNKIVRKILDICKNLKINFAQIQLFELSHLSVLLGEQHDYETLEWLLTTLWNTRDAQRSWPPEVLLNLGRRLICARYLAGSPVKAIRLAEDIAYNMRRAHGPRAPITIETYELLAQLYTSMGQTYQSKAASEKTGALAQEYFKKALVVHEDILRLMVHEHGTGDDSDDELDTTAYLLAKEGVNVRKQENQPTPALEENNVDRSAVALRHLQLLKLSYQRLGSWPKAYEEYERLNAQVFRTFLDEPKWKNVQGIEKWSAKDFGNGKAESQEGGFDGLENWALGSDKVILRAQNKPLEGGSKGAQGVQLRSEQAVAYA